MLMFVLVSTVAAQADWSGWPARAGLIAARLIAKTVGVGLGNVGSSALAGANAVGGLRDDAHVLHRAADCIAVCGGFALHRLPLPAWRCPPSC